MQARPRITISVHDSLPREEASLIDQGLGDFNESAAPLQDVRVLSCFARNEAGVVLGGAVGRTWGLCCELQQLWVNPAFRRQGIGAHLVREFHQAAEARGCSTFYLETYSFQAPGFYRALGYEAKLAIEGYATGVTKFTMVRQVSGPRADA